MLHEQAENLWTADHELRLPFAVRFPTRMTVVRLSDGSLALISPVPIDGALDAELAALGPVTHLVAPNCLHHLHLARTHERYPKARLLGPPGLGAKVPGLTLETLDFERFPVLGDSLAALPIDGAAPMSETVLFHARSRTLIVTDLVFNIQTPPAWPTALLLTLTGTRGRLAQSRVWRWATKERARTRAACRRLFAWDFDRLIVAHGEVISSGAKERLRAALTYTGDQRSSAA